MKPELKSQLFETCDNKWKTMIYNYPCIPILKTIYTRVCKHLSPEASTFRNDSKNPTRHSSGVAVRIRATKRHVLDLVDPASMPRFLGPGVKRFFVDLQKLVVVA